MKIEKVLQVVNELKDNNKMSVSKSKNSSASLSFWNLLQEYEIEIPIIQRDYAQGRDDGKTTKLRNRFLDNIINAITEDGTPLELDFVYGSVEDKKLQPLDGQQRLTTLFLLHWYIALKTKELPINKNLFSKFTYETRISSREFCQKLVNTDNLGEGEKISEQIKDSSWFFMAWEKDPTIKAMLNMLDSIEEKLQNISEEKLNTFWTNLTEKNQIIFHFTELNGIGLTDDLYIKMNARGKQLTDFENFKASFGKHIKDNRFEKDEEETEKFSHKIDTVWTDLFWKYKKDDKNEIDQYLMNFFHVMALNNHFSGGTVENGNFVFRSEDKEGLRKDIQNILFEDYQALGCFSEVNFNKIKAILNKLSIQSNNEKEVHIFLPDNPYLKENDIFKLIVNFKVEYAELITIHAYYSALALEKEMSIENLNEWVRFVRNIVEGSRGYNWNDITDFSNALKSITNILNLITTEMDGSVLKYLREIDIEIAKNSPSGFLQSQFREEITKAKLIQESEDWKNAIIEAENHGYFKGQIGFLLDWCKEDSDNSYNLENFNKYWEKASSVFDENGLKKAIAKQHLFHRALLTKGDYLLTSNKNKSFLKNKDRDRSWKRLLRDKNDGKRDVLKKLFDDSNFNENEIADSLEKIIENLKENDWRVYFITVPKIMDYLGDDKFIREEGNRIFLLQKTQLNGSHSEYYSYSFYLKHLEEKKILESQGMIPQTSTANLPYAWIGNGEENGYAIRIFCSQNGYELKFILKSELCSDNILKVLNDFGIKDNIPSEIPEKDGKFKFYYGSFPENQNTFKKLYKKLEKLCEAIDEKIRSNNNTTP